MSFQIVDYSGRRGAIVPMLTQIYKLYNEGSDPRARRNYILWSHDMNAELVDISRRWYMAVSSEGGTLLGLFFFRLDGDGKRLFINELRIAKKYENKGIFEMFLQKFERDSDVKARSEFYLSKNIKWETSEEILDTVGLAHSDVYNVDGYKYSGDLKSTISELKIRYQA